MKSSKISRSRDENLVYILHSLRAIFSMYNLSRLSLVILQIAIEIVADYTCSRMNVEVIAVFY